MKDVLSLDDIHLSGKRVLYRVDINSPLHPETGAFLDDGRLRAIIPTLNSLSEAKVVILGHQSRPGKDDFTDLSGCLLYTSPSPRDVEESRFASSA